ncbi:hypothetical protein A0J57_18555 [Sphingobium sp. 22B]|uniref:NmrA family NAD(P)-binding protein n=1 Tax=unclassified Sphingobium TaxID=2611147 RepID=UPI0007845B26|nr:MULTISPECIES: NmrA family NAD(P)-binding protein [unclassified Sphingobium]KXU30561.1 hypothetical protein AXW74_17300 [Sphingobium sp. AM]KYC30842.1 hypothetical protein A0J57_18555 [Sphingobium sp. 22B]OAP30119.1 hypothetical protein A8O16_20300 [Sphingobium sp. 20006FA]
MTAEYPIKAIPRSIAVFGAGGRMGRPFAQYVRYAAPDIRLRLITSSPSKVAAVQKQFPGVEVVAADYCDRASLVPALEGMEGIFVVTPSGLDEQVGMTNLIDVVRQAAAATHIIRVVGYEPESPPSRVPAHLREMGGDGSQHYIAKAMLDESGLPVTFLNCGASLMDNLLYTAPGLQRTDTLIWPQRYIPLIDPRDFAEVAARVLLSDDARHITQFHTVNNGQDQFTTTVVAEIMSDVFKRRIVHDGSKEGFLKEYGPLLEQRQGRKGEGEYRWAFFEYEYGNSVVWALNNFAERMLGRKPNSFRSWLMEHRHHFFPDQQG